MSWGKWTSRNGGKEQVANIHGFECLIVKHRGGFQFIVDQGGIEILDTVQKDDFINSFTAAKHFLKGFLTHLPDWPGLSRSDLASMRGKGGKRRKARAGSSKSALVRSVERLTR